MSEQIIESPLDGILQEDLISVAESDIPLDALCNSTVLVTGATGLIGSILIKSLLCCFVANILCWRAHYNADKRHTVTLGCG